MPEDLKVAAGARVVDSTVPVVNGGKEGLKSWGWTPAAKVVGSRAESRISPILWEAYVDEIAHRRSY